MSKSLPRALIHLNAIILLFRS